MKVSSVVARTPTVSDKQILEAAQRVIGRRGSDAFTLAEVASDVGLSRAAVILRFKSTQSLKVILLTRMVDQFILLLGELPKTPSGDNLLNLAGFIGKLVPIREALNSFFMRYSTNVTDHELATLEFKRGEALHIAISHVMPELSIDHQSAIQAFTAHIAGTIMALHGEEEAEPRWYLVKRTEEWLRLAGIPFNKTTTYETLESREHEAR